MTVATFVVLLLVLGAELVNGWTDAPNAIATVVGTRALTPRQALVVATVFNTVGAFSGTAVATTIGTGIVDPSSISITTVGAAMVGIILWSSIAARWGIPTSESHALIAGLAGAGLAASGPSVLLWVGWRKVLIGLVLSSAIGFVAAYAIVRIVRVVIRRRPDHAEKTFRWLQIASSAFVAFSHGSNDGQKFMGMFTLTLVLGGVVHGFAVPTWVVLLCAAVMAVGTSLGGWRIVRTLGDRLTKLETHQGFAAEMAAAGTITAASAFGIPLSTTQTIGTAIMGVGVVDGVRNVRWPLVRNLAFAWLLTFPICGALSWAVVFVMREVPRPVQLACAALIIACGAALLVRRGTRDALTP
jgi:inorganic phosphate transporter, PiT family